jgi:mRNA-degrading endonuclease RelE of RelBE toxin-antitoxin system
LKKRFKVILSPPAQREIERLEPDSALQIVKDIKTYLEISPLPFGKSRIKKLTGFDPTLYRMRSGDFRAYYRIISTDVVVLGITHKKDSEKALKKFKKPPAHH